MQHLLIANMSYKKSRSHRSAKGDFIESHNTVSKRWPSKEGWEMDGWFQNRVACLQPNSSLAYKGRGGGGEEKGCMRQSTSRPLDGFCHICLTLISASTEHMKWPYAKLNLCPSRTVLSILTGSSFPITFQPSIFLNWKIWRLNMGHLAY